MKNSFVRIALLLSVLGTMITSACGPGTQTNAPQQPSNTDQAQASSNSTTPPPQDPPGPKDPTCSLTSGRLAAVQAKFAAEFQTRPNLKHAVRMAPNNQSFEVLIEGKVRGWREFRDLSRFIHAFMQEQCVATVYFVPPGTIGPTIPPSPPPGGPAPSPAPPGALTAGGFEWQICQAPANPCPDGSCDPGCKGHDVPTPTPTP